MPLLGGICMVAERDKLWDQMDLGEPVQASSPASCGTVSKSLPLSVLGLLSSKEGWY